jgi:rhamnogalacturonyl hydrolase YesR
LEIGVSHEGWQRKSSVEQSGTEIAAYSLTQSFYGGACPNKTFNENALKALNNLLERL